MDDVRKLVKVKPLEWKDWSARHRVIVVAAEYTITQRHFPDMHFVIERLEQNPLPPYDTLEAAKAAAQADYEARIYAALAPASDGRAEALLAEAHAAGLREAAEECQRLSESYTRSLAHYDDDHPERAKIKWGAAAVTVAAENILARITENGHE